MPASPAFPAPTFGKRLTARHLIGVSLLCGLTTLALPALAKEAKEQPGGHKMPPPVVPVLTVQPQPVTVYETFTGSTAANRSVDVRAQIGGILDSRDYTEGQLIKKDASLFKIDDKPYVATLHEAQAAVSSAQAALNAAQRDWNRISTLFAKGVVSVKDRDDAQSALEIAKAGLQVANAKVSAAQINVNYTKVTAPITGIAGLRAVAVGNLIKPGDELVQINDIDPIQVLLTYSADNPYASTRALNPTPAHPTTALLMNAGKPIKGSVNYRSINVDPQTNTVKMRALFPNPAGDIKPNAFVRVKIQVAQFDNALVIPQTALTSGIRPGSYAVYTVSKDNEVHLSPVELGPDSDKGQIIESGLSAGERVVTDGLIKLRPGIQIEPLADKK
ncbi:efflux RND transporter periplasmic adaptor subunit [Halothiobacillus diazotrophicus]|uniref:efflux RND transporter periplasmic adaptor subunit n=1 Tax=Halothiobacillus diazotrophicus TaxID=1860122 RepID=UPI0009EF22CD|nr:efflux RND transporter periplasmic adaptor subunit [Halothiobacillus diazotrophicus]